MKRSGIYHFPKAGDGDLGASLSVEVGSLSSHFVTGLFQSMLFSRGSGCFSLCFLPWPYTERRPMSTALARYKNENF